LCAIFGETIQIAFLLIIGNWHTQDGQGEASFGYSYPGQASATIRDSEGNMAGSWSYVDADGNLV
jgi:hypothetical protein